MKIQVLGTGCAKCKKLTENVEIAIKRTGVQAEVEKVTDVKEIARYKVLFTPALAIGGVVKIAGKVAKPEEIEALIRDAQE